MPRTEEILHTYYTERDEAENASPPFKHPFISDSTYAYLKERIEKADGNGGRNLLSFYATMYSFNPSQILPLKKIINNKTV